MRRIEVKGMYAYKGHNVSANGSVNLTLCGKYSQLTNSVKMLQMLNNDVVIQIKMGAEKPFKIGSFRIKNISFDDDGESVLKFNSLNDFVDVDKINNLITKEEFNVRFVADVEEEEDESEEE